MLSVIQFPMSEYVKDASKEKKWKTISYGHKGRRRATETDGAPLTADGMDEGAADESGGEEAPVEKIPGGSNGTGNILVRSKL
jgi:hypothetical protein